ncbi:S8 family serine peptidase [Paenibacillus sp. YYML68]|uniref:S8 family serine peptidase n=1 Tax=Paenibacillus sp. YYML68 TaxID=2909250 RepID=UPI00248FAF81|nr:S8 family serine peptidase [Paenibacillus sp. YYML68]
MKVNRRKFGRMSLSLGLVVSLLSGMTVHGEAGAQAALSSEERYIHKDWKTGANTQESESEPAAAQKTEEGSYMPGKVLVKYKQRTHSSYRTWSSSVQPFVEKKVEPGQSVDELLNELEGDQTVEYAEPVYVFRLSEAAPTYMEAASAEAGPGAALQLQAAPASNDPLLSGQWAMTVTDVTYGWQRVPTVKREAVTVAVIDTGVDASHPDLAGRVLVEKGYDAYQQTSQSSDVDGHGTAVAGVIAAAADNGIGIAGAAPGVRILPIRAGYINSANEFIIPSDALARAIRYAIGKADIINLSLGIDSSVAGESNIKVVREAIEEAQQAGIVVVAAAGNDSNHWLASEKYNETPGAARKAVETNFPASMAGVVSVGALQRDAQTGQLAISDYSNIGSIVTTAPGSGIYTTSKGGTYSKSSGTSFSAPFVAGVAAMVKAQQPGLSPDDVMRIIYDSSLQMPIETPGNQAGTSTEAYRSYFGGGLVSAKQALVMPRLTLTASEQLVSGSGRLYQVSIAAKDDTGQVVQVSGPIRLLKETPAGTTQTVTELTYGKAELQFSMESTDAYYLGLYADDTIDSGTNSYVLSNSVEFAQYPVKPQASLASGTYIGNQTLTLTTSTPDASIYYTQDGSMPTADNSSLYTGPITISASRTITAVAVKNGVASESVRLTYTITAAAPPPFFGGGGGFLPPADKEVKLENGRLIVTPSKQKLLEQLTSGKAELINIEAKSEDKVAEVQVELPADVWKKAAQSGAQFRIEAEQATIRLPAKVVELPTSAASVKLTVRSTEQATGKPAYAKQAAPVLDLGLEAGGRQLHRFASPVTVELKYDPLKLTYPDRAAVFYYNEDKGIWEYVGGELSKGIAKVELSHFSQYTVMEWNRTFTDTAGHWAQQAIERMAARQIADGIGAYTFAPEGTVTRAQFTTLLARALRLEGQTGAAPFRDVPDGAWFHEAVGAAYEAGIVSGVSDGQFAPDAPITREQMAVMLVNAVNKLGLKLERQQKPATAFGDTSTISEWAREAVLAASAALLLEGHPDGSFDPQGIATRAQAVTVLSRLPERR